MSTGEGENPRDGQPQREADNRGGQRIGVGGGDDSVSRIQLAARWAEAYAIDGDSLTGMLKRFRVAYEYLDAVIHGVEPPELDHAAPEVHPSAAPPPEFAPPQPTPPPAEPRPWG
jgi:hypothetical protein